MKWHNVSSAIRKWVFKIKCITIEIIVSFWAHTRARTSPPPNTKPIFFDLFFVLVPLTLNMQQLAIIENTDEHMNKLLLFPAAIDTAKSHGTWRIKWIQRTACETPEEGEGDRENLINIFTFERAMASNRSHSHSGSSQCSKMMWKMAYVTKHDLMFFFF